MARFLTSEDCNTVAALINDWRSCFPVSRPEKVRKGREAKAVAAELALHDYLKEHHFGEICDWSDAAVWVDSLCEPGRVHYREMTLIC